MEVQKIENRKYLKCKMIIGMMKKIWKPKIRNENIKNIDILGVNEIRLPESEDLWSDEYRFIHTCLSDRNTQVVFRWANIVEKNL